MFKNSFIKTISFMILSLSIVSCSNKSHKKINESLFPNCNIKMETNIFFSNPEHPDRISVEIFGAPCYKGKITIRVHNENREFYRYEANFKPHVVTGWSETNLNQAAYEFASDLIVNCQAYSKSLPQLKLKSDITEIEENQISISTEKYNTLRSKNIPLLFHFTGYETWRYVMYSSESHTNILILDGGN